MSISSLPAWGAWIEIQYAPHFGGQHTSSLPAWGAWIEIIMPSTISMDAKSLPAWGAWIEIPRQDAADGSIRSLPAWGAWIEMIADADTATVGAVAPRVGSVD